MTKLVRPDYEVFIVKEFGGEEKKSKWTKIGAGWSHKDGDGLNIQLDAIPVDGKLSIRKWKEKKDNNGPTSA